MKLNLKVRFKNPTFWTNLICSIVGIILAYFGLNFNELTSWGAIGNLLIESVKNPVVVFSIIACIYNALIDPTTRGLSDSERALAYIEPR